MKGEAQKDSRECDCSLFKARRRCPYRVEKSSGKYEKETFIDFISMQFLKGPKCPYYSMEQKDQEILNLELLNGKLERDRDVAISDIAELESDIRRTSKRHDEANSIRDKYITKIYRRLVRSGKANDDLEHELASTKRLLSNTKSSSIQLGMHNDKNITNEFTIEFANMKNINYHCFGTLSSDTGILIDVLNQMKRMGMIKDYSVKRNRGG